MSSRSSEHHRKPMVRGFCMKIAILLLLSAVFGGYASANDGSEKKQLAIINSYNEVAPWPRKYINAILQEVELLPEFDAVRVSNLCNCLIYDEEDYLKLEDSLFMSYTDTKPDYVVLIGNFSFNLRDRIKKEWGDIPILLICQSDKYGPLDFYFTTDHTDDSSRMGDLYPLEDLRDDYNFTAVVSTNRYWETVDMMVSMFPDMYKFVFLADGLYINRHLSHQIKEYLSLKYPDIEYEWLLAGPEGMMLPYLNNEDPNIGLLLSTWYYTAPGVTGHPQMSGADSFMVNGAKRPVFGLRYAYFDYGTIGGYYISPEKIMDDVRDAFHDLLSGKDMRDVPFRMPTEAHPYINYTKLEKLGLSTGICPKGTVFIDKPKSVWEKYQTEFLIAAGAALALIVMYICFKAVRRGPKIRQNFDTFVNSMPIGYMQAVIRIDRERKVKKVEYQERNRTLSDLIADHGLKALDYENQTSFWQTTVDTFLAGSSPDTSILQSPDEESYIEFIINPYSKTELTMTFDIFAIDISDKMKVEQVLREAARKAVEADNMKSVFLANMSHEIRTPLNAIVGFSNLLCKTDDPVKKKRFIEIIETNNQLLLKLIGDILDISKSDADKLVFNMHKVDINKLLANVASGIDLTTSPAVSLEVEPGLKECFVTSDPYRITQVLNNLLTNAVKFTERGYIKVGYTLEGEMLRFYVKDTGLGIAEGDMKKLFTRFTKLNSFVQGTGLGLSISKAIIEKLGGSMKGESPGLGKGSSFTFTIPFVLTDTEDDNSDLDNSTDTIRIQALKQKTNPQLSQVGEKERENKADTEMREVLKQIRRHERKKILVVEDNESNYQLFNALLDDRYELVHAKDGEEAVVLYARETPDLILMDINLPYKNGYEATAEIRMLSKAVPIIAVTAYAQQADRERILNSGFDAYISKPVEEDELLREIDRFI